MIDHAVVPAHHTEVSFIRRWGLVAWLFMSLLLQPGGPARAESQTESLDTLLKSVCREHKLPALAAAVVSKDGMVAVGAVGVRATTLDAPVTLDDRFHIGSCTKSMTATVCAMLVEQGRLSWNTTIADIFPDLRDDIREEYRAVTLEQLLYHRSGLASDREPDRRLMLKLRALMGTMPDQRRQFLKIVLNRGPAAKPGSEFLYSNFGYTIAGAMAEQIAGKAYEQLLSELLFEPLGITSGGFGAPGTIGEVDQPCGHVPAGAGWAPVPPGPLADNPAVISPAGCLHLSIGDWARYAVFQLRGARGEGRLLKPETFKRLHSDRCAQEYALGWGLRDEQSLGGTVLTHGGSNGAWYAVIWIAPQSNVGVVVATNAGGDDALNACRDAVDRLMGKFADRHEAAKPAGAIDR